MRSKPSFLRAAKKPASVATRVRAQSGHSAVNCLLIRAASSALSSSNKNRIDDFMQLFLHGPERWQGSFESLHQIFPSRCYNSLMGVHKVSSMAHADGFSEEADVWRNRNVDRKCPFASRSRD